ncbi:MAG: tetratricopeptide repeat protein [Magnetococcales bacterium]|nr:tetratricopeptide repeat protein [Magnetococcales bacterium]
MRPKSGRARPAGTQAAPASSAPQQASTLALAVQEALQLHNAGQLDAAEAIYQRVLQIQPNHPDALHLQGFIFYQRGQGEKAAEWIGKAVAIQPDRPIFFNNLGIVLSSLGRPEEAIDCYRKALAILPDFYMALGNLGAALADRGQREEAIACFQRALTAQPNSSEIHNSLGNVLLKGGQYAEAIESYQRAIQIQPDNAGFYNGMGTAWRDQGRLAEAVECYRKGLAIDPNHYDIHNSLGSALLTLGKPDEAIAHYQQAIRISPNHPNAYHNVGNAFRDQGRLEEAVESHRKALAINPNLHQTHNSMGNALQDQGKLDEAVECYKKALALQPNDVDTLCNLGVILTDQKKWDDSLACYQKAAELSPNKPTVQCELLNLMLHLSDWTGFHSRYQKMMAAFHSSQQDASPFIFLALPTTPAEQKEDAERYMRNKYPARANLAAGRRYESQPPRLKIGYLSSDFQNHPVAYLTAELLELHDRNRFEITAYSYGPDDGRDMRRRIMAASDHFVDMLHMTHKESAQRIFEDGTHILMDLNGFTKLARLQIPALRPAPIQASWLGYLGSLGSPFIDYLISDSFITPKGCEADFTEKLVRLPETFQPNDRQRRISERTPTRQERGLPEGVCIFASFNKSYKINPDIFSTWMRILQRAPNSILWLVTDNQRGEENLRREAMARGIDPGRLFFVPKMPLADYLANYRLVDLVLDTYPYNSGTTASNALWAGCPMLTCAGRTFVSRQAGSLMRGVGLPELVTHSLEAYEELAVALAGDPARLAAMRQRLQANLLSSPLFDTPRFTRHLEAAYEAMWQRFQAGLPPEHLDLQPLPRTAAPASSPPPVQVAQPQPARIPSTQAPEKPRDIQEKAAVPPEGSGPGEATRPVDAAVLMQEAMRQHRSGQFQEAERLYRQLLTLQPQHPETLYLLGETFYQRNQPVPAAEWIGKAVAAAPANPFFPYNLGLIWNQLNKPEEAILCFRKVLAIQPRHAEALYQLGNAQRKRNDRAAAIACYRQALAIDPQLYEVHNSLGNMLRAEGDEAAAIACYQQTLTLYPNHQNACTNLGNVLSDQGQFAEAIRYYRRALEIQPALCEAHNGLGYALQRAGQLEEAVACFRQALQIDPTYYKAYHNQGHTLRLQGNPEAAVGCYQQALAIHPNSPETLQGLGGALAQLGREEEAIACYQKQLSLQPDAHAAHTSLGELLRRQGRPEEAMACYQKALDLQPDDSRTLGSLALLLADQERWNDSIRRYQQAADLAPDNLAVQCALLHNRLQVCDWEGFQGHFQQMMALFHAGGEGASPFKFLAFPTTAEEQKTCAERLVRNHFPLRDNLAATRHYAAHPDRLKIGYLSFDYQEHPGAYVAAELFAQHDRSRVEVIAYACNPDDGSPVRQQLMAACDRFVDLHPLPHKTAAQRILEDGVHILMDLNGLTRGARPEIAALRPAPIQLSWLGTATTVGAPFFDYFVTDPFMAPPGSEAHYTEKLLRLPYFFQPRRTIAASTPTRQACGLPEEGFVFVCFNQPYKINPSLFDVWMRLLQKTPGSILWLRAFNPWAMDNLRREAEKRGVAGVRLCFAPRLPSLAEHVARYRLADLALDTHPYSSGSTGWDTLTAGCPMVSCAGVSGISRAAGSQLTHVGLPDLICHSLEEYEQRALALAHDPARLAAVRQRLQEQLPTALLFDAGRFARHLEEAYAILWQRFQGGEAIDHLEIGLSANKENNKLKQGVAVNTGKRRGAAPQKTAPARQKSAPAAQKSSVTADINPSDPRLQEAMQHQRAGRPAEAIALYQKLLAEQPRQPMVLHLLGHLYFQQGQPALAADAIGKAAALSPNEPVFWQNLGIILASQGKREEAIAAFQKVLAIQPNHHEVLYHLGNCFREQQKRKEAIACFQKALALQPDLFDVHNSLGNLLLAEGQLAEAIASYRRAVAICPTHQNAYTNLGNALIEQGNGEEAIRCHQRALEIQPNLCEAHNGLGNALKLQGKHEEAILCFQRAAAINPAYFTAYHNQGVTLQLVGRLEEAIECYRKVLAVQPLSHETYNNLGSALAAQGQMSEAIAYYQKALEIQPQFYQALGNIGIARQKSGDLDGAIALYRQALTISPTDRTSLCNLAFALQLQGDVAQSIAHYQQVLDMAPEDPEAHGSVLHQMLQICDWRDFQGRLERMTAALHASKREVNPFILLSLPSTPKEQYDCAVLSSQAKYTVQRNLVAGRSYELQPKRLKIGYLSADYQDHATTHLIAELFELHDRDRFEVIAYSYGQDDGLSMRRRVMAACDQFVDLLTLSHQASAQRILEDGVHILLELKGFTKDSRLEIPAFRPAPIQVSWLGYPGTVGAPFIDYVLTDPFVTPPGFEGDFTEKIVRLDGCYQPNDRQRPIAPHTPSRRECGLPEEGFVFTCFNKNYKINPPIFDIWMRLLKKTPGSVLWLFESNHWVVENIRREAEQRGVESSRIYFAPKMPPNQHLARYRRADLVLDTFPYTSHTTGSDALWAGCPLLTYAGQTFASRVAGSLLVNVGLPELVTYSLEEYEALALELAHDPARLAALRQRLNDNLAASPLFDSPRFTRSLEASYEAMWQQYVTRKRLGLPLEHIDVHLGDGPAGAAAPPPARPTAAPAAKKSKGKAAPASKKQTASPAVAATATVAELLGQARALQTRGKGGEALALYNRILAQEPKHAAALYGSAAALGGQGLVEEGLQRLCQAREIALQPEWESLVQPLILRAGEVYNAALKANQLEQAARIIEWLARINPESSGIQEQALVLFKKLGRAEQTIQTAKRVLTLNPDHFAAHQELVDDCMARKDLPGELGYRIAMARRHSRAIPTAFHLQEIYMAMSALLLTTLDKNKVTLIEGLQSLAQLVITDNPVQPGDAMYHSSQFYRTSIEAVNIQAVTLPVPPPQPWPTIEFATANGKKMDRADLRAYAAGQGAEVVFYVAADPIYASRHARRYLSSLLKHCDVPFLVVVQIVGGLGRLPEFSRLIGIDTPRLLYAADAFDPASIRAVTWKINEEVPIRTPLVYYQSARFLWLDHLLEQFQRPMIVSDVDQLLQKGLKEMMDRLAPWEVVFHEGTRNVKMADRLIANLLLVKPTDGGRLFARFFRYYMNLALQNAEAKGSYAYFLDQNALLMARHHLQWMIKQPRVGYFDPLDVNVGMFKSYQENPFRFLSFYTGFDMDSLPKGEESAGP